MNPHHPVSFCCCCCFSCSLFTTAAPAFSVPESLCVCTRLFIFCAHHSHHDHHGHHVSPFLSFPSFRFVSLPILCLPVLSACCTTGRVIGSFSFPSNEAQEEKGIIIIEKEGKKEKTRRCTQFRGRLFPSADENEVGVGRREEIFFLRGNDFLARIENVDKNGKKKKKKLKQCICRTEAWAWNRQKKRISMLRPSVGPGSQPKHLFLPLCPSPTQMYCL